MRRAPYVIAGTVAGIAGVLAFPTHKTRLVIPTSSPATTTPGTTSPAAAAPATTSPTTTVGSPPTSAGATPVTAAPATTAPAVRHATGTPEQYRYGVLSVTVTVEGGKLTDVAIASISETDGRSVQIDDSAIPQLRQQVLASQSTNIDGVAGATYTSQAYVDSVQAALDSIGFK